MSQACNLMTEEMIVFIVQLQEVYWRSVGQVSAGVTWSGLHYTETMNGFTIPFVLCSLHYTGTMNAPPGFTIPFVLIVHKMVCYPTPYLVIYRPNKSLINLLCPSLYRQGILHMPPNTIPTPQYPT